MVGIVCGAYSSVCVTETLWYVMKKRSRVKLTAGAPEENRDAPPLSGGLMLIPTGQQPGYCVAQLTVIKHLLSTAGRTSAKLNVGTAPSLRRRTPDADSGHFRYC